MAKLIVKSPYIKCTGGGTVGAQGYLHYVGTREHVQKLTDDRPPTRKQMQLLTKLVKDFPTVKEMDEYTDYAEHPNKANASALITMALESNWDTASRSEVCMKYIATRPRAERLSAHGLFGDEELVDMGSAMAELQSYTGNVWTHIISLKREDAARLGYDNAGAWRNLIRAHRNEIAAAMKIPPDDFRWYAAFHDVGGHPHIHMMAWSVKPGQAYLSRDGIREIKSKLTNDIFKQEMLHLYEQKSTSRDELVQESRRATLQLVRQMQEGICDHPELENLMMELAQKLETVHGKKSYGYLPKPIKALVDEIVNQMERLPVVQECYDRWLELQGQVAGYYSDTEQAHLPLSAQKEFRAIKNVVIKEAEHIRCGRISFEDKELYQHDETTDGLQTDRRLWRIIDSIQDNTLPLAERDSAVEDLKAWAEHGNATAQYFLGKLYRDGGITFRDTLLAAHWFEKSAGQDMLLAQYALGKLLLSDDDEIHNPQCGMEWLEYAAAHGSHYAAYCMGKEYLRGVFVPKNSEKAVDYFTAAAQSGNQYAQYILGKLLLTGREVRYDKETAQAWLTQSARQGNPHAQFLLERIDDFKPPSVLLAGTRLLHHLAAVFRENSLPKTGAVGFKLDKKQLQKLREKKISLGHKADDREEYQGPSISL